MQTQLQQSAKGKHKNDEYFDIWCKAHLVGDIKVEFLDHDSASKDVS
jgi:hypothetical protein